LAIVQIKPAWTSPNRPELRATLPDLVYVSGLPLLWGGGAKKFTHLGPNPLSAALAPWHRHKTQQLAKNKQGCYPIINDSQHFACFKYVHKPQ